MSSEEQDWAGERKLPSEKTTRLEKQLSSARAEITALRGIINDTLGGQRYNLTRLEKLIEAHKKEEPDEH